MSSSPPRFKETQQEHLEASLEKSSQKPISANEELRTSQSPDWSYGSGPRLPSDEELIGAVLEIDNPKIYERPVKLAPGFTLKEIAHVYNYRDTKVRCAVCGFERHYRGFIAELEDGSFAVIGHKCGEEYFPGNWDEHYRHFNFKIERQEYLRRIAPTHKRVVQIIAELHGWQMPMAEFDRRRQSFKGGSPIIYKSLDAARHRNSANLVITSRERNRAAEEIRDARLSESEKGTRGPIYNERVVWQWQLAGAEVFDMRSPSDWLAEAQGILRRAKSRLEAKGLDNLEFRQIFVSLNDLPRLLANAQKTYDAWNKFVGAQNLVKVGEWIRKLSLLNNDELSIRDGTLYVKMSWGEEERAILDGTPLPTLGQGAHSALDELFSLPTP